jgi:hypothetical protein
MCEGGHSNRLGRTEVVRQFRKGVLGMERKDKILEPLTTMEIGESQ